MNRILKRLALILAAASLPLLSGCGEKTPEGGSSRNLTFVLPEPPSGSDASIPLKTVWNEGDAVSVNGTVSSSMVTAAKRRTATMSFSASVEAPYTAYYPADVPDGIALSGVVWLKSGYNTSSLPLCGHADGGTEIELTPLYSIVRLGLVSKYYAEYPLVSAVLGSNVPVSGAFKLNAAGEMVSSSTSAADHRIAVSMSAPLDESIPVNVAFVVPPGTYPDGLSITVTDSKGRAMVIQSEKPLKLSPGQVLSYDKVSYTPDTEIIDPDAPTVGGKVVDTEGNPLPGVVVSDGYNSTLTLENGTFSLKSDLSLVRLVYVSTPSGYEPPREGGMPLFYRRTEGLSAAALKDITFTLTRVSQDKYTVLFSADPQPRARTLPSDNVAYHSLDVCEDLFRDMKQTAQEITDGPVYGVCLGDLVHNDVSLFPNYVQGLAGTGFITYSVIGNHDHDQSAADDDSGGLVFERYFGPRNYSFNIGKIHFVVVDDLIMRIHKENGKLGDYDVGLNEEAWMWLQGDLALVPRSTKIFFCAHAPLFRGRNGTESSANAPHGADCAALLSQFRKVHTWFGHTHKTFNYIYPDSGLYPGMEVHVLARSTGALWLNEYVAGGGTPRGFTTVTVEGDKVSWKFHPLRYQTASYTRTTPAPVLALRDWTYDRDGLAILDGKPLDESYQIHAYPKGAYDGDNYVYANVFLYDSAWGDVYYTPDGGSPQKMTQWMVTGRYDAGCAEYQAFYKTDYPGYVDYDEFPARSTRDVDTIFRIPAGGESGGTVSVIDRFGNTWSRHVSW